MVPSQNNGNPQFYPEDLALVSRQNNFHVLVKFDCIFIETDGGNGVNTTIWGGFPANVPYEKENMLNYVALPCPPYNVMLQEL